MDVLHLDPRDVADVVVVGNEVLVPEGRQGIYLREIDELYVNGVQLVRLRWLLEWMASL